VRELGKYELFIVSLLLISVTVLPVHAALTSVPAPDPKPEPTPEPEPDTDGDGILDINDQCITEPENYNGFEDKDGCPDTRPAPEPTPELTPELTPEPESLQESSFQIPEWVRNNAEWWAQDAIGDSDFVSGIQYLIQEGIMQIPETTQAESADESGEIPAWIKNNADWWAQELITDDDFVKGIQYLVEQGIIKV